MARPVKPPTAPQLCRESFSGETPDGRSLTFFEGESVLDPAKPGDAELLRLWGKFFSPILSTTPEEAT